MERGQTLPRIIRQTPIRAADELQDFSGLGFQIIIPGSDHLLLLLGIDKHRWVNLFPLTPIGMFSIIRFHFFMANYLLAMLRLL